MTVDRLEGAKYEKAQEWRTPVTNVQWLSEVILGNYDALHNFVMPRYQIFDVDDPFKLALLRPLKLMGKWKGSFIHDGLLGLKKKNVILPFATDPKILKSTVGFKTKTNYPFFLREKNVKAFKTEKYQPKEGRKKSKTKKDF